MSHPLSSYLLDTSLADYTTAVVVESLRDREDATKKNRASSAVAFFEGILDPSITEENEQLAVYASYRAALENADAAKSILEAHEYTPSNASQPLVPDYINLTPAQRVLALPDTLDIIFSNISTLSKSTRDTLHAAALTSVSLHYAAQLRLWRNPRDLDTIEQQVRFAFGVSISSALGEGLGGHVKRLRIRVTKGAANARLVTKIIELCPAVVDLTLHWGDSDDGAEVVTTESALWLSKTLALLSNLTYLNLAQYSFAQAAEEITVPEDAHIPFTKLQELQLYGFHWYFDAIERGIGSSLKSLDIGYGTRITVPQVIAVARKVTSLTSLRFVGALELEELRLFVQTAPGLESIDLETFDERDDAYTAGVYTIIANLPAIKDVSVSVPVDPAQITQMARSAAPLESFTFAVGEDEEESSVKTAILDLIDAKKSTLKKIYETSVFKLSADDQFVEALAGVPGLERIALTFNDERVNVSDAAAEKLLTQCPRLTLTDGLSALVSGKAIYEEKYKAAFEKALAEEEEELSENILAN